MPNETETRLRAAIAEMQALFNATTERCLNLAADNAVLRAKVEELTPKPEVAVAV